MISADVLRALVDAGATAEMIVAAVIADREHEKARGPRSVPKELRQLVLKRDRFLCSYCGTGDGELCADHVVPYSRGGATSADNLVAACRSCNASKKDRLLAEWRPI
jgi:5-methylcytosine-specific restriction endonuclease McrA